METINILIKIISLIVIAVGIIMIYDARKLSQKWFSFGDRNVSVRILKFLGFVLSIIGSLIIILK